MSDSEKRVDNIETVRNHPEEAYESKLSSETIARVLKNRRRRAICRVLANGSNVTTLDELVDALMEQEANATGTETERDRELLSIRLHHVHLPLLEDIGLIAYEHRCGTVRYWGHSEIENFLN
ncbi:DUF7344 domain-containing protein [Haladaptatus pallidirubidus]|uniref:DUF7344 domain-containing protein n=2 Tax=Haladaptatus pallidirubidus TaxID=1008152 RepID=A0AAV3UL54_9EURY|nr:hypothetical protein [Haladaptatus pallidirubidus]